MNEYLCHSFIHHAPLRRKLVSYVILLRPVVRYSTVQDEGKHPSGSWMLLVRAGWYLKEEGGGSFLFLSFSFSFLLLFLSLILIVSVGGVEGHWHCL